MLFLVICALILAVIGFLGFTIFFIMDSYYDLDSFGASIMGSIAVGVMGFLVLAFISIVGASFVPLDETVVVDNTAIISLDRNTAMSGHFVLGIGSIGQTSNYHFYVSTGENEYELRTITSDDGRIIVAEGYENPTLIEYEIRSSNWFLHGFFNSTRTSYRIQLPEDSIDRTMQP